MLTIAMILFIASLGISIYNGISLWQNGDMSWGLWGIGMTCLGVGWVCYFLGI